MSNGPDEIRRTDASGQGPTRSGTCEYTYLVEHIYHFFNLDRVLELNWDNDDKIVHFYIAFVLFDYLILHTFRYLIGHDHVLAANPFMVIIPVGILFAAFSIRYMRSGYESVIDTLDFDYRESIDNRQISDFKRPIPTNVKVGCYLVALLLWFWFDYSVVGIESILADEGIVAAFISDLILIPLVYIPVIVDFFLLYVSIQFLLPYRIVKADINLNFFDPFNRGGLWKAGDLIKHSYYLYTVGLLLYLILTYGPYIVPLIRGLNPNIPPLSIGVFFTLAWIFGVCSLAYSILRLHFFIRRKRVEKIREIDREIKELVERPYDINEYEITDLERYQQLRRQLELVKETKEYPITVKMGTKILGSALLPQLIQVFFQYAI